MASIPGVLRQLRRARREQHGKEIEDAYATIFRATAEIGGEDAFEALADWALARTRETGSIPPPTSVRDKAREILTEQDASVPDGSALSE